VAVKGRVSRGGLFWGMTVWCSEQPPGLQERDEFVEWLWLRKEHGLRKVRWANLLGLGVMHSVVVLDQVLPDGQGMRLRHMCMTMYMVC